jgi:glyoxylase-like metal-dependent hydrolase (beta-lactamase superfamily II)
MTSNGKSFQIGNMECITITDGAFTYPTAWIFSNAPLEQVETGLRSLDLPTADVKTPYTCLLLKTGKRKVLVDTGADGLAPTTGNLLKNLEAHGISPREITDVILTHGHPDHIGGVLDPGGRPVFANAQYVMSKTEWDFWKAPDFRDTALDDHIKQMLISCAQKNLLPLSANVDLPEGEKEVAPGIQIIPAPGHTPGHLALLISSSNQQLLHMSDAVLHPLHLENPSWRNVFDLDPELAATTRKQLLDRARADRALALAYHFPSPGLGRVESKGAAWKWEAAA